MWTQFMDMHSGGGQKLDWAYVYIEAPEEEAKAIFFNRFGRNPDKVTCTCCGPDYSISSDESLAQLTGYERGCASGYLLPDGTEKGDDYFYSLPMEKRAEASQSQFHYFERPCTRYSFAKKHVSLEDMKHSSLIAAAMGAAMGAALAGGMGLSGGPVVLRREEDSMYPRQSGFRDASHVARGGNPAGTKLLKQMRKGTLGINRIR